MAESRLPVPLNQEYRVKLGRSFTFPKENAFHTIKYDFKPKSVDSSQPGRMKVNGDEVSVSLPVAQAESSDDVVLFKGAKRICTKECILIINTATGEAILEKITNTVQLKGVRDPKKKKQHQARSVSPLPSSKTSNNSSSSRPLVAVETTPKPTETAAADKKAKRTKKANKETKRQPSSHLSAKPVPTPPLPPPPSSLNPTLTLPESISPLRSNNPTPEPHPPQPKKQKESLSSSGSDSSSSSSEGDSDDEMDFTTSSVHQAPPTSYTSMPQFTSCPPVNIMAPSFTPGSHMTSTPSIGGKPPPASNNGGSLSDSSSSGSSSSEDSSSSDSPPKRNSPVLTSSNATTFEVRPRSMSVLKRDLEMSDSDSD